MGCGGLSWWAWFGWMDGWMVGWMDGGERRVEMMWWLDGVWDMEGGWMDG